MRRFAITLLALVTGSVASAQPQSPKLVIDISVDQLSPDLLNEYRPQLHGGLARLASQPASATANLPVAGQSIAVAGDAAGDGWFWNGKGFATNGASAPLPRSVPLANSAVQRLVAAGEPALVSPPFCASKAKPGGRRFARASGDYGGFETSPSLDGATLALAAGLIQDLRLGRDAAPDRLSIGLSATGRVARAYGAGSEEMCLQLFELDRELGDFRRALDRMKLDYAIELKR